MSPNPADEPPFAPCEFLSRCDCNIVAGRAPVLDSCGIAGGYSQVTGGGGETPPGAKQGDNGSQLPAGESETWKAGSVVEVGWMVRSRQPRILYA